MVLVEIVEVAKVVRVLRNEDQAIRRCIYEGVRVGRAERPDVPRTDDGMPRIG